jgi:tuftelin-interacting protein 11
MARKRVFLDDVDSDSASGSDGDNYAKNADEDADERDERELFENPYGRKRKRRNGKEDAIYGVFGDDSEEEGFGRRKKGGDAKPATRTDWAKAPSFVSRQQEEEKMKEVEVDDSDEKGMDDEMDTAENDSDDSEASAEVSLPPSPRVREEEEEAEEEERPRFGGLGLGASKSNPPTSFSGFTKGGIGAFRPAAVSNATTPAPSPSPAPSSVEIPDNLPSAFGAAARAQRSFVRSDAGPSQTRKAPSLAANERAQFNKLKGSFGSRMLEKMGWQSGTGLGSTGEGIVTPIESKLRPKNMGIAFRGFGERTDQSKAEARRRGEAVSDDEEKKPKGGKKSRAEPKRADAWQKPKKVKIKIEHKTYEQIVADAGQDAAGPSGIGVIIDATGATVHIYS